MSTSQLSRVYTLVQKCWTECLQGLAKASPALSEGWLAVVNEKYSEPQRHYHTLQHVADMLAGFEEYKPCVKESKLLTMAIIFHDIIYDPRAGDNEERSADLFKDCAMEINLQPEKVDSVAEWILKTKSHKTEAHCSADVFGTGDVHYLLDLDMAILGSSKADYELYASQIRQEYIHIPEQTYREKRAQVLQTFLQQANIYATPEMRGKFEQQARLNIQQEIERLNSE